MLSVASHGSDARSRSRMLSGADTRERRTGRPVVLFVEDQPMVRYTLAERLAEAGYEVIQCERGEAALELLNGTAPVDARLTDLRLPGRVDGWDLAEAARRNRPDLPVVYVSAYSYVTPRQVPGSVMLDKPAPPEAVIDALSELIG